MIILGREYKKFCDKCKHEFYTKAGNARWCAECKPEEYRKEQLASRRKTDRKRRKLEHAVLRRTDEAA